MLQHRCGAKHQMSMKIGWLEMLEHEQNRTRLRFILGHSGHLMSVGLNRWHRNSA